MKHGCVFVCVCGVDMTVWCVCVCGVDMDVYECGVYVSVCVCVVWI